MIVKKFKEMNEDMGMMDFFPDDNLSYSDAFDKYIKGQKAISEEDGVIRFENGYSVHNHGGGCSGEDCNSTWIEDNKGKKIAKSEW